MKACVNYHTEQFMAASARQAIKSSSECDLTLKKGKEREKALREEVQMKR